MLKKAIKSPLDYKEIQPVNPKCALEGLMLKLKLQYDAKSQLNGKDPDPGKD